MKKIIGVYGYGGMFHSRITNFYCRFTIDETKKVILIKTNIEKEAILNDIIYCNSGVLFFKPEDIYKDKVIGYADVEDMIDFENIYFIKTGEGDNDFKIVETYIK